MEYALLRSLRALGPGLIVLGYFDLFLILVLGKDAYFWELDSAKLLLVGYVIGGVYGVFASQLKRDRYAFDGVSESTLAALQKNFPQMKDRSWRDVSPCFYRFVDTDKSLEQKSKGIYFNGFIVTTSFDAMWLSLVAGIFGSVVAISKSDSSFLLAALVVSMLSYGIWRASVKRHCELAKDQVAVIRKRLANEFQACVEESAKLDQA